MFRDVLRSFLRTIGRILAYLAVGAIIALFALNKPKAAELNSNYQMVMVGNEIPTTLYVPGDNTALISKIEYTSMPNLTEDYTLDNYLILEVCTNGPMSNISMSKINNNSYFSSNDIVVYNTNKSCKTANNYDGKVYYLQLRVDKWYHVQSSDGYLVQGNLSIKSSWGYYTLYTFTNAFTSQEDYLSSYENQQKLQNSLDSIGDKQDQTNEKLDKIDDTLNSEDNDFNSKKCGIVCKLKGLGTAIFELPGKLVTLLIDGLKSLFIPSDTEFITNFVETIEDKLGFIAEVPVACINFILGLADAAWDPLTSLTFPSFSIMGYQFWDEIELDLTPSINLIKPFKYLTDVGCVVLCVYTLQKWRDNFTGGGD